MKYAWITEHRDSFPIAVMCDVLRISTSGYYDSLECPPSPRAQRHAQIQQAVRQVHAESHGNYGSLKITRVLKKRADLEQACRKTVAAAMREMGISSRVHPTTTQATRGEQAPSGLYRHCARPQVGHRHHVRRDRRGLGLRGRRLGLIQS